jgi:hypothetical protein
MIFIATGVAVALILGVAWLSSRQTAPSSGNEQPTAAAVQPAAPAAVAQAAPPAGQEALPNEEAIPSEEEPTLLDRERVEPQLVPLAVHPRPVPVAGMKHGAVAMRGVGGKPVVVGMPPALQPPVVPGKSAAIPEPTVTSLPPLPEIAAPTPEAARPPEVAEVPAVPEPPAPKVAIRETNLLGKEFQRTGVSYWLNGEPVQTMVTGKGGGQVMLTARAIEGVNILEARATARGTPLRFFPYLKDLGFGTGARRIFTASSGDQVMVDSFLYEDDNLTKVMMDRLHMNLNVSVAPEQAPAL